jgi:hypothetical protein
VAKEEQSWRMSHNGITNIDRGTFGAGENVKKTSAYLFCIQFCANINIIKDLLPISDFFQKKN